MKKDKKSIHFFFFFFLREAPSLPLTPLKKAKKGAHCLSPGHGPSTRGALRPPPPVGLIDAWPSRTRNEQWRSSSEIPATLTTDRPPLCATKYGSNDSGQNSALCFIGNEFLAHVLLLFPFPLADLYLLFFFSLYVFFFCYRCFFRCFFLFCFCISFLWFLYCISDCLLCFIFFYFTIIVVDGVDFC